MSDENPVLGYDAVTLRDLFAGLALAGLLAYPERYESEAELPMVAYELADAMLAARAAKGEG